MSHGRGYGFPTLERDDSRAGLWRMRPFGEAKSISGHQTLQLKGREEVFTLPAFQRCLEGRARRSRATGADYPLQGDRRRPSPGTSRPTGKTGETREENPIGSQRIHSTCRPNALLLQLFVDKGSLFCKGKQSAEQI
ncbi:hypothetical protein LUZ60_017781 [Juncus effusus]|nr:hypothetical protein LUZ60_017781 [Juncus effusus]